MKQTLAARQEFGTVQRRKPWDGTAGSNYHDPLEDHRERPSVFEVNSCRWLPAVVLKYAHVSYSLGRRAFAVDGIDLGTDPLVGLFWPASFPTLLAVLNTTNNSVSLFTLLFNLSRNASSILFLSINIEPDSWPRAVLHLWYLRAILPFLPSS